MDSKTILLGILKFNVKQVNIYEENRNHFLNLEQNLVGKREIKFLQFYTSQLNYVKKEIEKILGYFGKRGIEYNELVLILSSNVRTKVVFGC